MEISTIKQFILIYIMASILSEISGHYGGTYRGRPWRRPWHRPGGHHSQSRSSESHDRSTQSQDRSSLGSSGISGNKAQSVCNNVKERTDTFLSCCPQCTVVSFSCEEGFNLTGKSQLRTERKSLADLIKLIPQCIDIDECTSSPCKNNGVCDNSDGSYSCNCTGTGYTGFNCQVEDTPVTKVDDIFFEANREECEDCLHPCRCICARRSTDAMVILPITTYPAATEPIVEECGNVDLVFVIHGSELTDYESEFLYVKQLVISVTSNFKIGMNATRVALVQYNDHGILKWNLNESQSNSHEDLENAITGLDLSGYDADLVSGVQVVVDDVINSIGDRPNVPNAVVVFDDGHASYSLTERERVGSQLQEEALVLGVRLPWVPKDVMAAIASGPNTTNVFTAFNFVYLTDTVTRVVQSICSYAPPEPTVIPEPVPKEIEEQCFCCCPNSDGDGCTDV